MKKISEDTKLFLESLITMILMSGFIAGVYVILSVIAPIS